MYCRSVFCYCVIVLWVCVLASSTSAQPPELPYGTILTSDVPATPLADILAGVPAGPTEGESLAWYDPRDVFSPTYWDGNIQFGLNASEGNAEAFSMRTGIQLSRETVRTNWDIDLTYAKTESFGVETQHNALLWSNWDFRLKSPRWSWFVKFGLEYDEFKNFDIRLALNTGLGYFLVDTPETQFRARFGGGASSEIGGINEDVVPEAVFGFDFSQRFNNANKLSIVHDYYPDWTEFANFRQVTDAGWEILLSESSGLSLKLGVIHRYDSTPEGVEKSDLDYSALLIWAL